MADLDTAIVAVLAGDAVLTARAPGGVWFGVAPEGVADPYVLVRLTLADDLAVMGDAGIEAPEYQIEAVAAGAAAGAAVASAAARVRAVLETADGWALDDGALMVITRTERIRLTETDGPITVQRAGGIYAAAVSRG